MRTGVALVHPTHGHVTPTLRVAAELARRGERIVFYATERSRARIEAAGVEYRPYPRPYNDFDPTPPTTGLFADMERLAALSHAIVPTLAREIEALGAHYLLADTKSLWGRLTAQRLKIPAVTLSVVFALNEGMVPTAQLVSMLYAGAPSDALRAGLLGLSRYFEHVRNGDAALGVSSPGVTGFLSNPQPLNLIFTSREFQLRGGEFPDAYQFIGAALEPPVTAPPPPANGEFPWHRLTGAPLVYVSLGTTFHNAPSFYRHCFQAFAAMPWQVVLSAGGVSLEAFRESAGEAPSNFLVAPYVPQLALLERASVFVTHGGMNSVQEGLYFGVPMVAVPQRGDQFLSSARIEELGAGLALLPQRATPEALREAAARLLGESGFRHNAAALGESLRRAGGCARAATLILEHLAHQPPANATMPPGEPGPATLHPHPRRITSPASAR